MNKFILLLGFIFSSLVQAQQYDWHFPLETTNYGSLNPQIIGNDVNGNYYITSSFAGEFHYDPNDHSKSATTFGDSFEVMYLQKFDSLGNLVWFKKFADHSTSGGGTWPSSIHITNDQIIIAGNFTDSIDFNPGLGVNKLYLENPNDGSSSFLIRLDLLGNYIDGEMIEGYISRTVIDQDDNVYYAHNKDDDFVIAKVSKAGIFLWENTYSNMKDNSQNELNSTPLIDLDVNGDILSVLTCVKQEDLDHTAGTHIVTPNGTKEDYLLRLDKDGNFKDANSISKSDDTKLMDFEVDEIGSSILTYSYESDVNMTVGGTQISANLGNYIMGALLVKVDATLSYAWHLDFKNLYIEEGFQLTTNSSNDIILSAISGDSLVVSSSKNNKFYKTINPQISHLIQIAKNGDLQSVKNFNSINGFHINSSNELLLTCRYPSPNRDYSFNNSPKFITPTEDTEQFVIKYKVDPCFDLLFQIEETTPLTCLSDGALSAIVYSGTAPYTYLWKENTSTDSNLTYDKSGLYSLKVTDANSCSSEKAIYMDRSTRTGTYDFGTTVTTTEFRPGFEATVWVSAINKDCSAENAVLTVTLDDSLSFSSASITPDQINGNTLTWNFSALKFETDKNVIKINCTTSQLSQIGDSIIVLSSISPTTSDANNVDNFVQHKSPIVNGYDPNLISIVPEGSCNELYLDMDELYTFTIQFQNTGNDEAWGIVIQNHIDSGLDYNSLVITGASHDYSVSSIVNGIVSFNFPEIYLPDSTSDEINSHGFITYQIKASPNSVINQVIMNTAGIYFDYNPVVNTNTLTNTLIDEIPLCVPTSTLKLSKNDILVYPNPNNGFFKIRNLTEQQGQYSIYDITGKSVYNSKLQENTTNVDLNLNSGIYILKVNNGNYSYSERIIIQK